MAFSPSGFKSRNPYGQLAAVRSAEMFFGRENALSLLYNALLDGQCLAIIGPRRVGKSSLLTCCRLFEIQQRLGYHLDRHLLILVDLEEHLQRTPDDFFVFICELLLQQSRPKISLDMPSGAGSDRFSLLLSQCKSQGIHPVLLLDEFDAIVRNPQFNPDFFSFLRAQANAGRVSYVTASFSTLDQICHSDIVGSPFFNIFSHHHLGPLTQNAARALITIPSTTAKCTFTENEIQFIFKLAGRHPFYIQRTCYFLFEEKNQAHRRVNAHSLANQVYEELLPHFAYAWNHLDANVQEHLKREALRKDARQRHTPELSESLLFRRFVRSKAKIALEELTMEYLRKILEKLDDIKQLGECYLSNFTIVVEKEQSRSFTTVERGMRVYKLLNDALAQLQPTDSASGGHMYTILLNCYFKKDRRSNKQLASYLGMSERDFYRKRDDAVAALLNILLKMENAYIDMLEEQE